MEHCGLYQDAGNRCACKLDLEYKNGVCELPFGAYWDIPEYLDICNAEGRVLDLNSNDCAADCGDFETNMNGKCECADNAVKDYASVERGEKNTITCIASETCADYLRYMRT